MVAWGAGVSAPLAVLFGQYECVLADRERTIGPDHPDTIVARADLAFAYRSAGRLREAVVL